MPTQYISSTYIDLWKALEIFMRLERETSDKDRRLAARLSGLIFAFFSLEAYLNHLGRKTSPDIWEGEKEREYFSGRKKIDGHRYSGPTGKLQFLYSKCGLFYDENSEEMRMLCEALDYVK